MQQCFTTRGKINLSKYSNFTSYFSLQEFSYWFSNPLNSMVEGNRGINSDLISRLHSIMRPFLLRRLKKDVEKQLPGKFEHIVMCKLSRRQQFLYEEFMARSSTRSLLSGANYMGMMNILMQLRKVRSRMVSSQYRHKERDTDILSFLSVFRWFMFLTSFIAV